MPNREDEFWINQEEDLRYCSVHKRYYDINVGCQLCFLDKSKNEKINTINIQLKKCPYCKEVSLFWNEIKQYYECLNPPCSHIISKSDVERLEGVPVPKKILVSLELFKTMQCSWCRTFFTQPFLCPHRKLQSNCVNLDKMDYEERERLLESEKWWWRIWDMIRNVQEKGTMCKCKKCGALNPNPQNQKYYCWSCNKGTFLCLYCDVPLKYDIDRDEWSCSNAGCPKRKPPLPPPLPPLPPPPTPPPSIEKVFLVVFSLVCVGFAVWAGYLLYNGDIGKLEGILFIIIPISIIIWIIYSAKKKSIWKIITLFLIVILLGSVISAFAGIEPFSSILNNMLQFS
jgi:hypothetical protein